MIVTVLVPVILAGGGGTRLWPLSREHYPKQFLSVSGADSLLQQTAARLNGLSGESTVLPPYVVCNETHRFLVAEQLRVVGHPAKEILLEPVGRNTAPALTAAALIADREDNDPVLIMMPADHAIGDLDAFRASVVAGLRHASMGRIAVFGVIPSRAETGYGYIELGAAAGQDDDARLLRRFVEKPDADAAIRYVQSGNFLWNSGMFMMKTSVWLRAISHFRPDIYDACVRAIQGATIDGDFIRLDADTFARCPSESVDYAVMERLGDGQDEEFETVVLPLDCGWSDVGAWSSLWEISARDDEGNALKGDVCAIDVRDSVVMSEHRLVAAIGCEDLVVVETADAVMVAPKSRAQEVKRIVEWLKAEGREERLSHRRVYRPWGTYEGVDSGERFQVKRIVVNPGAKLSLQMHHHRAEHWIVVRGTAEVTRGEETFLLSENQSTYIPLGVRHRLANPGSIPLEIIEVQSGSYLGEDDIIRFDDIYRRT